MTQEKILTDEYRMTDSPAVKAWKKAMRAVEKGDCYWSVARVVTTASDSANQVGVLLVSLHCLRKKLPAEMTL